MKKIEEINRLLELKYPTRQDMRELIYLQKDVITELEKKLEIAGDALEELVELVEDARNGKYKIDSFTLQPALQALKEINGGGDE